MPDKPPTTWSADEAFWNEAWQDMDRRLSQRRRRRSPLPWLLLALLLTGLIGAGTQVQWSAQRADPVVHSGSPPAADAAPDKAATERAVTSTSVMESTSKVEARTPLPTEQHSGVNLTDPAPARPAPVDVLPRRNPEVAISTLIATLPPNFLAVALSLPQPAIVPQALSINKPARVVVAAGASTYTYSRQLGGFAELDYLLGRGRWRFPLALRYDYGARDVRADPLTQEEYANLMLPTGGLSQVDIADASKTLYTHELSLRAGVMRSLVPSARLTVAAGLGLRYTLAGEGPVVSPLPDGGALDRVALNSSYSSFSPRAQSYGMNGYLDPRTHRWGVDGWLQLRYQLGQQWGLLLGGTHAFSPVYRERRLDVDRTRVEIGLSKGF